MKQSILKEKSKGRELKLKHEQKPVQLINPEEAKELKDLIRKINESAMKKRREAEYSDDDLPPAA